MFVFLHMALFHWSASGVVLQVKEFKLKQSWKKVYAKDPNMVVKNDRTFHMDDEEETEVERDDIVEGACAVAFIIIFLFFYFIL